MCTQSGSLGQTLKRQIAVDRSGGLVFTLLISKPLRAVQQIALLFQDPRQIARAI